MPQRSCPGGCYVVTRQKPLMQIFTVVMRRDDTRPIPPATELV
jgi:hypothetical protein